jgi:hypothetical protein
MTITHPAYMRIQRRLSLKKNTTIFSESKQIFSKTHMRIKRMLSMDSTKSKDIGSKPLASSTPKPSIKSSTKKGRFRLRGTNYLITSPQNKIGFQEVKTRLDYFINSKAIVKEGQTHHVFFKAYRLIEEPHQDGGTHYHLVLIGTQRTRTKNIRYQPYADVFIDIFGKQPNIATLAKKEDVARALEYLTKDIINIHDHNKPLIEQYESLPKTKVNVDIIRMLKQGHTWQDIVLKYPEYYLSQGKKIQKLFQDYQIAKSTISPPLQYVNIYHKDTDYTQQQDQLLNFIKYSLNSLDTRKSRQKHLWLSGPTGIGKSHLVNQLKAFFKVGIAPIDGTNNYPTYHDQLDIFVLDEFNGQIPITQLNKFLDGDEMQLNVKNSHTLKTKNVFIIVLSNIDQPSHCRPYIELPIALKDALDTRFDIYNFRQPPPGVYCINFQFDFQLRTEENTNDYLWLKQHHKINTWPGVTVYEYSEQQNFIAYDLEPYILYIPKTLFQEFNQKQLMHSEKNNFCKSYFTQEKKIFYTVK